MWKSGEDPSVTYRWMVLTLIPESSWRPPLYRRKETISEAAAWPLSGSGICLNGVSDRRVFNGGYHSLRLALVRVLPQLNRSLAVQEFKGSAPGFGLQPIEGEIEGVFELPECLLLHRVGGKHLMVSETESLQAKHSNSFFVGGMQNR